jgi:hypothetical protein
MTKDELKEEFDDKEFCPNETLQENMDEAFDWFYSKLTQRDSEWVEAIEGMRKEYKGAECDGKQRRNWSIQGYRQACYDLKAKMGVK